MKKNLSIFIFFVLVSVLASAQEGVNSSTGYVRTYSETLEGDVQVNLEGDDLMIRSGRNIYNWTADKVISAAMIDEKTGEQIVYVTGTFGMNTNQFFFEVLSGGKMSLLYREGLKFSEYDEEVYPPYYILLEGSIHSMPQNKKEFLALFDGEYADEMADYFKSKTIDLDDKIELSSMFSAYNEKFQDNDGYLVKAKP